MIYKKIKEANKRQIILFGVIKFTWHKKQKPYRILTKARKSDALITLKCIRNLFEKTATVETLILGDSTARYGFIEDDKTINFGIDSQDLYYSSKILEKYINQIPNLKNIVLFYLPYSSSNNLLKSKTQMYRASYYDAFLDIPYSDKLCAIRNGLIELSKKLLNIHSYYDKNLDKTPKDVMHPKKYTDHNTENMIKRYVNTAFKLSLNDNMLVYLKNIIEKTLDNNLNLLIVNAPYRADAKHIFENLCTENSGNFLLFKSLYDLVQKYDSRKIKIYEAFYDDSFTYDDFYDFTHLNLKSAKKLTGKIAKQLGEFYL